MGTYAASLFDAIRAARPDVQIHLVSDKPLSESAARRGLHAQTIGLSRGYRWQLWERVVLPWHAKRVRADVLHSLANTTPSSSAIPRVVTVHDVIPYLPEMAGEPARGRYWLQTIPHAIRTAAAVITDSRASRTDIVRIFGVQPERIDVVPLAVGDDVARVEDVRPMLAALDIRPPYVLALGAMAPRKNTFGVLRVFAHAARVDADLQLVLTGIGRHLRPRVVAAISELGIPMGRVRLLDYVESEQRNALYSGASVFLFLSLYEGFGLPILEAMRCGALVICSTRTSCPEVAGTAAVLVDPDDEPAVADTLLALVGASDAERRARQSLAWAHEHQFTWQQTAEKTLSVYDRVTG
jgi:glycosyltransferase involved in cell wall biosynthesis